MQNNVFLVTGASGFLGGRVVKLLFSKYSAPKIRIIVRKNSNVEKLKKFKNLEIVYFDSLTDKDAIDKALKDDVTHIIHCAALSADWGTYSAFYNANVIGTQVMLDSAVDLVQRQKQRGTTAKLQRFVHISTCDVYGYPDKLADDFPLKETNLPYNKTKVIGEKKVWEYVDKLPITIIRPSNIFGPEDKNFVFEACDMIDSGLVIGISKCQAYTAFTYVDNCCDAIVQSCLSNQTIGKAYNVQDNFNETLGDFLTALSTEMKAKTPWIIPLPYLVSYYLGFLLELVYWLIGWLFNMTAVMLKLCKCSDISQSVTALHQSLFSRPPLTRHMVQMVGTEQRFSMTAAERDFNYKPQVDFTTGIKKSAEWYLNYKKQKTQRHKTD